MDAYTPKKEDRFSFGLWTVGNPGRDPFGQAVRPKMEPAYIVEKLADCGAWGVNLHDDDLIPPGSTMVRRDAIVSDFKAVLKDCGMVVPMASANLFSDPVFKDGAYSANDPRVRALALRKTMAGIDLAAELGASTYVFWGGREGSETDACRDPRVAIQRLREALDFLCAYALDQGHALRFALEPKPNEPRGDIYLPTVGHMLHFISTLQHPDMVGVNPEMAHETMSGLSFVHAVAQAMDAGKLFHIDLNAQKIGRYDQDLRFGSEDQKQALLLLRLLEGSAGTPPYDGPRHFDAHAYRSESEAGVWDFARGCMRTYKILAERARAFDADPEVREILAEAASELPRLWQSYSPENAAALRQLEIDATDIARHGLCYERLDQILVEYLLGVRS